MKKINYFEILKFFLDLQISSIQLLIKVISSVIYKSKNYFLGIEYTDAMVQMFYLRQDIFMNNNEKRHNKFDHKEALWYQNKFIISMYRKISPIKFRLISYFLIILFFSLLIPQINLSKFVMCSILILSPRIITSTFLTQNYNFFPFILVSASVYILYNDPSLISLNDYIIGYLLTFTSSILSITCGVINIVIILCFSIVEYFVNKEIILLNFIPHLITILGIYLIKLISSGTSIKAIKRLANVIGLSKKNKASYKTIARPVCLSRSIILNIPNIALNIIILSSEINLHYKFLITIFTFIFIMNESYLFRFLDTKSNEAFSLLIFSIISITINSSNFFNYFIFIVSYFLVTPIIWTTIKINRHTQTKSYFSDNSNNMSIFKLINYFNLSLMQIISIPKNLKKASLIDLNMIKKEYDKFFCQLPIREKNKTSKVLILFENYNNYNQILGGCTDFLTGLDYLGFQKNIYIYPSLYEEWFQGHLYPKFSENLQTLEDFSLKEFDFNICITSNEIIKSKLSSNIICKELKLSNKLKETIPEATKIFLIS